MELRVGDQVDQTLLRVGELARRTGLTVRTLHHYDAIGLLMPSIRTAAGHRLYTAADVARLQQIASLRRLGLSLLEIREWLLSPSFQPRKAIDSHVARLREELAVQQSLLGRLERIADRLEAGDEVPIDYLIEVIRMTESPLSPEHMALIQELHRDTSPERIREVEHEWVGLFNDVRAAIAAGTDSASPQGRDLADRWFSLVREFTKGNAEIEAAVRERLRADPTAGGHMPADFMEMHGFIMRARGES